MKVLALTSSSSFASIAISDGQNIFERTHSVPRGHTEFMNSALDEILRESNLSLPEIDLIALDKGPGSFTGIRVAVNIARTLCYSLQKPCWTCESVDLLCTDQGPLLIAINAFKNLVFCAFFKNGVRQTSTQVLSLPALESLALSQAEAQIFVGDAWNAYQPNWSSEFQKKVHRDPRLFDFPKASELARRAQLSLPNDWMQDWNLITPLYLRESAAEENLRKP